MTENFKDTYGVERNGNDYMLLPNGAIYAGRNEQDKPIYVVAANKEGNLLTPLIQKSRYEEIGGVAIAVDPNTGIVFVASDTSAQEHVEALRKQKPDVDIRIVSSEEASKLCRYNTCTTGAEHSSLDITYNYGNQVNRSSTIETITQAHERLTHGSEIKAEYSTAIGGGTRGENGALYREDGVKVFLQASLKNGESATGTPLKERSAGAYITTDEPWGSVNFGATASGTTTTRETHTPGRDYTNPNDQRQTFAPTEQLTGSVHFSGSMDAGPLGKAGVNAFGKLVQGQVSGNSLNHFGAYATVAKHVPLENGSSLSLEGGAGYSSTSYSTGPRGNDQGNALMGLGGNANVAYNAPDGLLRKAEIIGAAGPAGSYVGAEAVLQPFSNTAFSAEVLRATDKIAPDAADNGTTFSLGLIQAFGRRLVGKLGVTFNDTNASTTVNAGLGFNLGGPKKQR